MKNYLFILLFLVLVIESPAQDYQISFAGTGASTMVGTVIVENLTQGKSTNLSGSDVLHLVATHTGLNPMLEIDKTLRIYPNPTAGNSTIEFVATASGITSLELFDITGKRVISAQNTLAIGTHSFRVSGLSSGIYTLRIYSQAYTYTGKLVSNSTIHSGVKMNYLGSSSIAGTPKKLKSASAEKIMQYTTGDRLKITGTSGNYSTVVIAIPTQSKTITFTFVTCTDADGNNYPVVQIGTQIWMAENLRTTKYHNGDPIALITGNGDWASAISGAYCNYDNNTANVEDYGRLYNWYAVKDSRSIVPEGWHVPSYDESVAMAKSLVSDKAAGGKLKETSTVHWYSPNTGANNSTGFTGMPGGLRFTDGIFYSKGYYGYWWCPSVSETISSYAFGLRYNNDSLKYYVGEKKYGLSVRCVKDEVPIAFTCGSPLTINHVTTGGVAPVAKTVTYSTVTNIPGEPTKCWITSNLGADHQATAVNDATEASAGWYWQFNRKQGYKHDGTTRTPNSTWITPVNENLDWQAANDPCALELGSGWRIPTNTEWTNVDASGNWTNWNGPWNSGLKLHAAGYLETDGLFYNRGVYGHYWSNTQNNAASASNMYLYNTVSEMVLNNKPYGFSMRCLKDADVSKILVDTVINASLSNVIITVKNKIKVEIPKGTVLSNSRLTIEEEPVSNYPEHEIFKTHFIYNVKIAGQTTFTEPLKITFDYNPANLESGWTKDRLGTAYYHDTLKTWISYPDAVVDSALNQITFTTNHLTPLSFTEFLTTGGYQHKFENDHFIVYYTYAGANKVCDNTTYNGNLSRPWHITSGSEINTPFYIQDLAHWLSESWIAFNTNLLVPKAKINVYVRDIGGSYGYTGGGYIYNTYINITKDVGVDDDNKDFTRSNLLQSTAAHEMLHIVEGSYNSMTLAVYTYRWWMEALATQADKMVWGDILQHYETEFYCKKETNALGNVLCHSLAFSWDKAINWDWYAAGGFLSYLAYYRPGIQLDLVNLVKAGRSANNRNYIDNEIKYFLGGTGIGSEYLNYVQWLYEKWHDRQQLPTVQYSPDNPMVLDATLTTTNNSKKCSESSMPYLSTRLIKIKNSDILTNTEFEITVSKPNPEIRIFLYEYQDQKMQILAELNDKEKRSLTIIKTKSLYDILIVNTSKDNNLPFDVTIAQKVTLPAGTATLGSPQFVPNAINIPTFNNISTIKSTSILDGSISIEQSWNLDGLVWGTLNITWNKPPGGSFVVVDGALFWKLNLKFEFVTIDEPSCIGTPNININGLSGSTQGSSGRYQDWNNPYEPNFCLKLAPDNFSVPAGDAKGYSITKSYDISLKIDCGGAPIGYDGDITFTIKISNYFDEDISVVLKYLYPRD